MDRNPFTTSFGKEPGCFLGRQTEENKIIEDFTAEIPVQQVYMITGVRGSGKTALLTRVTRQLKNTEKWVIVELNPEKNLLEALVAKLSDEPRLRILFVKAKINLSLFGINLGVGEDSPVNTIETALEKMLSVLKKHQFRLLITIDEVTNTKEMRIFAGEFQILMRNEYPIYLIMTGLFKNIQDLQNVKSLTFLYRSPKIMLGSLSNIAVTESYKSIFRVNSETAAEMAAQVRGYAYAYQLYGSLCYNNKDKIGRKDLLTEYRNQLSEYVYEKLWSELSQKDKEIISIIARHGDREVKVSELIDEYNSIFPDQTPMNNRLMSVYRERLRKESLISTEKYGYVQLVLPKFADFVNEYGAIILSF